MDKSWPGQTSQFEAGREQIGKMDRQGSKIYLDVLKRLVMLLLSHGFAVMGVDYSPSKVASGNIEFLMYSEKKKKSKPTTEQLKAKLELAHKELNMKSGLNIRLEKIRRFIRDQVKWGRKKRLPEHLKEEGISATQGRCHGIIKELGIKTRPPQRHDLALRESHASITTTWMTQQYLSHRQGGRICQFQPWFQGQRLSQNVACEIYKEHTQYCCR